MPFHGLDPAGIHEVRQILRTMPSEHGVTVFLSSHLVGFIAANSADYGPWFPWSLTLHTLRPRGEFLINPMVYSTVAAALTAVAGAWHFTRSEM